MRLSFFRRNRWTFLRPRRGFREVIAAAGREAGPAGIGSLDLLVATLANAKVARLVRRLDADPGAIQAAARQANMDRDPLPGLSEDAKAVVEAATHRALAARSEPDAQHLLLGCAIADCRAKRVLEAHGIDAGRLSATLGGPPI